MNKLNIFLLILATVSAVLTVHVKQEARLNFSALEKAKKEAIALDQDYARLKLEQARLSNHKSIKEVAEKQNLQPPSAHNTVMLERVR